MRIRPAVASECAQLSALAMRAKAHWGYTEAQLEAWRAGLEITEAILSTRLAFVSELDQRIVGFYVLAPMNGGWELDHLWVTPESIGQGIGRALVMHARKTAQARGARAILVDADPNAEAFYRACGATRVGETAAPIEGQPDRVRPQLSLATDRSDGEAIR